MVRYYRVALNRGNHVLFVREEIDMIRAYLDIQRFAYESDFKYVIEVDEDILGLKMLKNLVQPAVENAVLHGIKRQNPNDLIRVTGVREGEAMVFTVADNGVGMAQDKLERVVAGAYKGLNSGYGLYNVQQRIRLYHGPEYGLTIQSEKGKGTMVTIRIKAAPPALSPS